MKDFRRPLSLYGKVVSLFLLFWFHISAGYVLLPAVQASGMPVNPVFSSLQKGARVLEPRQYRTPEAPTVYLTFDDGPSSLTPKVLDLLKKEKIAATFFVLGEAVKSHPDIIRRMVREGHSIGNHSYNHNYKELYRNFDSFWKQIEQTEAELDQAAGIRSSIIRAPGGTHRNFDSFYFYYLEQAGYGIYDWTIDSGDALRKGVAAKEILDNVSEGSYGHEVILLMHDSSGHGESVKALPDIIRLLKKKGYAFAPLTPDVKPVQFSLATSKWKGTRSYTVQSFEETLSKVKSSPGRNPSVPLLLHIGEMTLELPRNSYELKNGRLFVPLRKLAEGYGGIVHWNQQAQEASIQVGSRYLDIMLLTGEALEFGSGSSGTSVPLDIEVHHGTILVSVRDLTRWMGWTITAVRMNPKVWEVKMTSPSSPPDTKGYNYPNV